MSTAIAFLLGGAHPIPLLPGTVFTFGRGRQNSVYLKDAMVSRQHAVISCADTGSIHVMDLESSNKTFVNNQPIEPREKIALSHNDKIRFGGTEFYLVVKAEKDEAAQGAAAGAEGEAGASDPLSESRFARGVMEVPVDGEVSGRNLRSTQILTPVTDHQPEEPPALAGQLKVQSLPQVLQFLHHSANTGELYIKNPERDGVLLFDGGTIFNAHSKEDTGVEAVYSLALLQEGTFQFTTTEIRPGGETNVSESMMSIVFECCRRFDEARQ